MRRFLLHSLPKGFQRIRQYGFLANRVRHEKLPLCRALLRGDKEDATLGDGVAVDEAGTIEVAPSEAAAADESCPACRPGPHARRGSHRAPWLMPTGPPGPAACGHLVAPCDGAQGSVRLAAPTWSPASCVLDAMRRAAPSVSANSKRGTIATTASWRSIGPSSPPSLDTECHHRKRMPIADRSSVQQIVPGTLPARGRGLLADHLANGKARI